MTLRTLFAIPIAAILLMTLALAGMSAGQGWSGLERGRVAIEAVNRMRLLVLLQTALWAERVASNAAVGASYPVPDPAMRRLGGARRDTDLAIAPLIARFAAHEQSEPGRGRFLAAHQARLQASRVEIDALLAQAPSRRSYPAANAVTPRMLAVSIMLEEPLARVSLDVTAADPGLSGLLAVARLAALLKDCASRIPAVLVPRFTTGHALTADDVEQVHVLLAQASQLTSLLRNIIDISQPAEAMRTALADLERIDADGLRPRLNELMDAGLKDQHDPRQIPPTQSLIIPWSQRINVLRVAILDAAAERVLVQQAGRIRHLWQAITAAGAVVIAILAALTLLHRRVVAPLAQLGAAITRIAAGDRGTRLTLTSTTREIGDMVAAVETLRQAALVADAVVTRQREAVRQRGRLLREAVVIMQTVRESAAVLEAGVARLSDGIDAALALAASRRDVPPPTLVTARDAVREGLAEMRGQTAELDATIAAARAVQIDDDQPVAAIAARILAVQDHVNRRDAMVRALIHPSLVALRDAGSAGEAASVVRDLVSDQFQWIEATVTIAASMRAEAARAAAIVRDLPADADPLAA